MNFIVELVHLATHRCAHRVPTKEYISQGCARGGTRRQYRIGFNVGSIALHWQTRDSQYASDNIEYWQETARCSPPNMARVHITRALRSDTVGQTLLGNDYRTDYTDYTSHTDHTPHQYPRCSRSPSPPPSWLTNTVPVTNATTTIHASAVPPRALMHRCVALTVFLSLRCFVFLHFHSIHILPFR